MICPIEEKETLTKMENYVVELRYYLLDYAMRGIDPPETLLNELSLAEKLARILLKVPG